MEVYQSFDIAIKSYFRTDLVISSTPCLKNYRFTFFITNFVKLTNVAILKRKLYDEIMEITYVTGNS